MYILILNYRQIYILFTFKVCLKLKFYTCQHRIYKNKTLSLVLSIFLISLLFSICDSVCYMLPHALTKWTGDLILVYTSAGGQYINTEYSFIIASCVRPIQIKNSYKAFGIQNIHALSVYKFQSSFLSILYLHSYDAEKALVRYSIQLA